LFNNVIPSLINYALSSTIAMTKKIFAIIGALIAGGIGITVINATPAAQAAISSN
jgi:hypothetical protein